MFELLFIFAIIFFVSVTIMRIKDNKKASSLDEREAMKKNRRKKSAKLALICVITYVLVVLFISFVLKSNTP